MGEGEPRWFQCVRDRGPTVEFTGWLIASVRDTEQDRPDYLGRRTSLRLYRTVGGKYIAHRTRVSIYSGHYTDNTSEVQVCSQPAEVIKFFGRDKLALKLYEQYRIEDVEHVE